MSRPIVELRASNLRIDMQGIPLCERVDFQVSGTCILVAGPIGYALGSLLKSRASLAAGELTINGTALGRSTELGWLGLSPSRLPLPPRVTVKGYLTLCYRLSGLGHNEAEQAAVHVLSQLGMSLLAERRNATLNLPERRAVALAQALAPKRRAVFAETPMAGLDPNQAQPVLGLLQAVGLTHSLVMTVKRVDEASAESALLRCADAILVGTDRNEVWTGSPQELLATQNMMALSVRGPAQAFVEQLRIAGALVQGLPPKLRVQLPVGRTSGWLLELALKTGAGVVEMVPAWQAIGGSALS